MTIHQILDHFKKGLTMKLDGADVKLDQISDLDWRENKITVRNIATGLSQTVSIWDLSTEWTGGAWQPPVITAE